MAEKHRHPPYVDNRGHKWLSASETARRLGLSLSQLKTALKAGRLTILRMRMSHNGRMMYAEADVQKVAKREKETPAS